MNDGAGGEAAAGQVVASGVTDVVESACQTRTPTS